MRVFLWLFGMSLCLLPFLYTLHAFPFSLYKRYGGIVEIKFSFMEEHFIGFLLTSLVLSLYLYVTRFMFAPFKTLVRSVQPEKPAKLVILLFITELTGLMHGLLYSNFAVNLVVGFTYFLGFLGIWSIYESLKYGSEQKRWLTLFFGFMSVLIAFFTLEALL